MDLLQLLKKDHQKAKDIFQKLEKTTDRGAKKREKLFTQLKTELTVHTKLEEQIFYPAMKKVEKQLITDAYDEHEKVDELLEEMEGMAKDSEEWPDKLDELFNEVKHHIKEEEGEIFKSAKQNLGKEKLAEMGKEFSSRKKEVKEKVEEESAASTR